MKGSAPRWIVAAAVPFAVLACDRGRSPTVAAAPPAPREDARDGLGLEDASTSPLPSPAVASEGGSDDAHEDARPPFDPPAWLAAHGVDHVDDRQQADLFDCEEVRIGAPLRDGLLCRGGPMEESLPGGESLFALEVFYADRGKLRVALRVPVAAGPLDQEMPPADDDPDHGHYILLAAELAKDGTTFEIHDRPESRCADRLRSYRAQNQGDAIPRGLLTPHIKVIEIACRARGVYRWRADRFTR